ncbi:galactose-specific lectin nattectin-like isoform X1 [Astatotilapia calliptera]|uniref:galactose-specific lectin nattectin-like isoform X1 n=1 Tax=Astatotilapia calliptera TaxID=8154 RepID=UPI000E4197B8|nr:galactose-specific lectin nattectin-like isoform X1 [Astatotilapia calliptera]XP_026016780.1 galactose-specific lectin nattectin-like isoform X1 [Astatotilapia calliptera]
MLTVSLLVCALIALARADATCPDNWSEFGGRCFHYVSVQMTWAEAEKNCQAMKAHLASVNNAEDNENIQKLIRAASLYSRRTWIGGTDCQMNDLWLWSDGSHFLFSAWKPGQPDNWGSNESCIEINHGGEGGKWNDVQCSTQRPSMCAFTL